MSRVERIITMLNCIRIRVPPAAVLETQQVLDGMPNILKLARISEVEGWLEMELLPASKNSIVNPYQVNRILTALIRARIPIMSFGPEAEPAQERFTNLATDVIG